MRVLKFFQVMNSKRESYTRPRLRPQDAEFTTLASEELGTQESTSLCFIN